MQNISRSIYYRHARYLTGSNRRFVLTLTEHLPRIESEVLNSSLKDQKDLIAICCHYNSLLNILYKLASIFEYEYKLQHNVLVNILDSEVDNKLYGLLEYFGFTGKFNAEYFITHYVEIRDEQIYLGSGNIMRKVATVPDLRNAFVNIKDKFDRINKLGLECRYERNIYDLQSDIEIMQMLHKEYSRYMPAMNWSEVGIILYEMKKVSNRISIVDIKDLINNTYILMTLAQDVEKQFRSTSLLESLLDSMDIGVIAELKDLVNTSECYSDIENREIKSRFGVNGKFKEYADMYIERGNYVEAIFIDDILSLHSYIKRVFDKLSQMI